MTWLEILNILGDICMKKENKYLLTIETAQKCFLFI